MKPEDVIEALKRQRNADYAMLSDRCLALELMVKLLTERNKQLTAAVSVADDANADKTAAEPFGVKAKAKAEQNGASNHSEAPQ